MVRKTSRESYKKLKYEGTLSKRLVTVLKLVREHPMLCAVELSEFIKGERRLDAARTGCTLLKKKGLIRAAGQRYYADTNRNSLVWKITTDGKEWLARRSND